MQRLIIIGAGGFGREVAGWARAAVDCQRVWEIGGFLDDNPAALDGFAPDLPLLGDVWNYRPAREDCFICAIGRPELRRRVWQHFVGRGAEFARVVHRDALVGRGVVLDAGVILCPRVVLTCDLHIGANTALNIACAAGHDVRVGRHCQLSSFCDLTGHVTVGDEVFMGSRASVLPGKRVGDGAVVGAGAVVIRDVAPRTTVFGNPAKLLLRH
jgi:sugar O-acyltransferase (sialic acid O-acetyltransferase NeuD family)